MVSILGAKLLCLYSFLITCYFLCVGFKKTIKTKGKYVGWAFLIPVAIYLGNMAIRGIK